MVFWFSSLLQVHSTLHGVHSKGSTDRECYEISNYHAWKNFDFGIYAWLDSNVLLHNNTLVDNKVGAFANTWGPDPLQHHLEGRVVVIQNSLFVGQSSAYDCTADDIIPEHGSHYPQRRSSRPSSKLLKSQLIQNIFIQFSSFHWHK